MDGILGAVGGHLLVHKDDCLRYVRTLAKGVSLIIPSGTVEMSNGFPQRVGKSARWSYRGDIHSPAALGFFWEGNVDGKNRRRS